MTSTIRPSSGAYACQISDNGIVQYESIKLSFGCVYSARVSMESVLSAGYIQSSSSAVSQTSSSSKSSSNNSNRCYPRPCLVWEIMDNDVEIMLMGSFEKTNSTEKELVFPPMPEKSPLERLLLVNPTKSQNELFPGTNFNNLKSETYLFMKPVVVPLNQKWKLLNVGPFSKQQLHFINEKIKEIMLAKYQNKNKDINELDNSTLSSIPNARHSIIDDDWKIGVVDKNVQIVQWLKDVDAQSVEKFEINDVDTLPTQYLSQLIN